MARIPLVGTDVFDAEIAKYGRNRGSGTTLPATDLRRGDTYLHTGQGGLFVYNGTAWRQVEIPVSSAAAAPAYDGQYRDHPTLGLQRGDVAGGWKAVDVAPLGGVFTASNPASSVPGSTLWGPGALTATAERGGWGPPTSGSTADRLLVPSGGNGLYLVQWYYRLSGTSGFGARNFLQVTVGSAPTSSEDPTLRSPIGTTGEDRGAVSWTLPLTAGQILLFTAWTSHSSNGGSASTIRLTRLGISF